MAVQNASPQWDAFANWLLADDEKRDRLNLPKNQAEYAISTNVSDRQLRRWKADPMFQALLEKKQGKKAIAPKGEATEEADVDSESQTPENEYEAIKSALVNGALTGDPKYLDLYFKTYGKDFVAEEAAARTSDLSGLDLSDLILQAASVLDESVLVEYLVTLGYTVTKGDANV